MNNSRMLRSLFLDLQTPATVLQQSATRPRRNFFTASRPIAQPKSSQSRVTAPTRPRPLLFSSHLPRRARFNSTKPTEPKPNGKAPSPTEHLGSPEPASLSQRLKKLSQEYGWTALGVYFALSAIDFPICFLAVRVIGTDRIGHWEHIIIENFWKVVRIAIPDAGLKSKGDKQVAEDSEEVEKHDGAADASIWTQVVLAYAVHKSLIFIRIPITAAVLPKVVKTLRGWGWNIGKRTPKTKPSTSSSS